MKSDAQIKMRCHAIKPLDDVMITVKVELGIVVTFHFISYFNSATS